MPGIFANENKAGATAKPSDVQVTIRLLEITLKVGIQEWDNGI